MWGLLEEMDHCIQAISPASVATISRAEMDSIMSEHPKIAKALYIAQLVDEGTLRTTLSQSFGRINAANLMKAHALIESGKAHGKVVLEGFGKG